MLASGEQSSSYSCLDEKQEEAQRPSTNLCEEIDAFDDEDDDAQTQKDTEGLRVLSLLIDRLISRVEAEVTNFTLRVELFSNVLQHNVQLVFRCASLHYTNLLSKEQVEEGATSSTEGSNIISKCLSFSGLSLDMIELEDNAYSEVNRANPILRDSNGADDCKEHTLHLHYRPREHEDVTVPKLRIEGQLGSFKLYFSPYQSSILFDVFNHITGSQDMSKSTPASDDHTELSYSASDSTETLERSIAPEDIERIKEMMRDDPVWSAGFLESNVAQDESDLSETDEEIFYDFLLAIHITRASLRLINC